MAADRDPGSAAGGRAVIVRDNGDVDVLDVQERPRPEPGPGELLVEVTASGINFMDVYRRQGVYPVSTPFVLGSECAGRVVALGDGVDSAAVGDLVASAEGSGTHAEYAIVPAAKAVPV